jgi:hypothetical protein
MVFIVFAHGLQMLLLTFSKRCLHVGLKGHEANHPLPSEGYL